MLRIGCCGFPVGLPRYVTELQLAEVQKTFYRIPKKEIIRKWREGVPEEFVFTVKAWQGVTHPAGSPTYRKAGPVPPEILPRLGHFQPTEEVFGAWKETREAADLLKAPVILLQAPPSFTHTPEHEENLKGFFSAIRHGTTRIALELRASWDREWLSAFYREFDLIHCTDPFREDPVTGPPFYLRLHGSPPGLRPVGSPSGLRPPGAPPGKRMYTYKYTEDDLRWLRDKISGWETEGELFCLFNNLSMWEDSRTFRDLVKVWEKR